MLKPLDVGRKKTFGKKCNGKGQTNGQTDIALCSQTQHEKLIVSDKGKDTVSLSTLLAWHLKSSKKDATLYNDIED